MGFTLSQFVTVNGVALSSISAVFSSVVSTGAHIIAAHAYYNNSTSVLSTVTDNVNNAGFTQRIFSTFLADTRMHVLVHDKLNLSSGRAASTYRVSANYSAAGLDLSFWAGVYDKVGAGNSSFGSSASSNSTGTGVKAAELTASTTPFLHFSIASQENANIFNSTVVGTGAWIATVNAANDNGQALNVIHSTASSLAQQMTHSLNVSTRALVGTIVYVGSQDAAGGAAIGRQWAFCMMGVQ